MLTALEYHALPKRYPTVIGISKSDHDNQSSINQEHNYIREDQSTKPHRAPIPERFNTATSWCSPDGDERRHSGCDCLFAVSERPELQCCGIQRIRKASLMPTSMRFILYGKKSVNFCSPPERYVWPAQRIRQPPWHIPCGVAP